MGCQPGYGICGTPTATVSPAAIPTGLQTPSPSPTQPPISTNGMCGAGGGGTSCLPGQCCSQFSWCGTAKVRHTRYYDAKRVISCETAKHASLGSNRRIVALDAKLHTRRPAFKQSPHQVRRFPPPLFRSARLPRGLGHPAFSPQPPNRRVFYRSRQVRW